MQQQTVLIVPTLNAGPLWCEWLDAFERQTVQPELLIVDSGSRDDTVEQAERRGFRVVRINKAQFNHGGTRQWAMSLVPSADVVMFMTQDAVLATSDAIARLLAVFDDLNIAAAYGRQLPRPGAGVIETHARLFNYGQVDYVVGPEDIARLGIKAAFFSNSFAAYRRSALNAVGGFPEHLILGEDTVVAGRLLLTGHRLAYCSKATVFHSHAYSAGQEFARYFDVGVLHGRERWMLERLGVPEGEGTRFLRSEMEYVMRQKPILLFDVLRRTACKYAGYRLGRMEQMLPIWLKRHIGMHKEFWVVRHVQDTQG